LRNNPILLLVRVSVWWYQVETLIFAHGFKLPGTVASFAR